MMSSHQKRPRLRVPSLALFTLALLSTLAPSEVLSQNKPSSDERSLYTSTSIITLALVGTSILFYHLTATKTSSLLFISSCSSEMLEVTSSTHNLQVTAPAFINDNRHALAMDLALAQGPVLDDLLTMLDPSHRLHPHLLSLHLSAPHRTRLIATLYTLDPLAWTQLLLTHPADAR